MSSVFALKVTPKKQIFLFLNLLLKIIDMFFNSSFDLFEFDAINITVGLPFLRISPDHGTNNEMIGKNKSNPQSLISSIKFFKKIK